MRLATPSLLLLLATAPTTLAQPDCAPSEATAVLEGNDVRARLYTNGNLFWQDSELGYEVPKGSGVHALFNASLLLGGRVEGAVRFAGSLYGPWEFRPGPLDASGQPLADAPAYDRLWRVTLEDIARYNATGEATDALLTWPAEAGAPVADGNGNPSDYDLAAGDRPAILGDETVWWVMNDIACPHAFSGTDPLGVEVRATAFAFSRAYAAEIFDAEGTPLSRPLRYTTLYRFAITNRSAEPLDDFLMGLFVDPILGGLFDDYVGSAPELAMGFVYNADDFDGAGYLDDPPALGTVFVEGLNDDGTDTGLYAFAPAINTGDVNGIPDSGLETYNYLRGRWRDGTPFTEGGVGYNPGEGAPAVRHVWLAQPPSYWSEHDVDGSGAASAPSDRRYLLSTGPVTLRPDETQTVTVALLWSRTQTSGGGALASVQQLYDDAALLRALKGLEPDPRLATILPNELPVSNLDAAKPPSDGMALIPPFPNPFSQATSFSLTVPHLESVRAVAYDVLGRQVAVLHDGPLPGGTHTLTLDGTRLPAGAYVVRVDVASGTTTRTVVKR